MARSCALALLVAAGDMTAYLDSSIEESKRKYMAPHGKHGVSGPELMELMTEGRFRHLPVERDGKLVGVVSIGDVVKRRIEEVEREADDIRSYIASA